MKGPKVLITAGLVLALSPVLVVGVTATGITVISAAIAPQPCASSDDETSSCAGGASASLEDEWNFAIPNASGGLGGGAALAAVAGVGRGGLYVAEGNGPVDFDCSGLTAWAWRQVGVSLPDYSYSQWDVTARSNSSID